MRRVRDLAEVRLQDLRPLQGLRRAGLLVDRTGSRLALDDEITPAPSPAGMPFRLTDAAVLAGDRVQFTAPFRDRQVANRELGTLERIDAMGRVRVRLESGRRVAFSLDAYPHLNHGYAVTSHSSQGQTANRVLIDVDTATLGPQLVNRRLAYVAVSRGRYDAQIYTNDVADLPQALSRDITHRSAIEPGAPTGSRPQHTENRPSSSHRLDIGADR